MTNVFPHRYDLLKKRKKTMLLLNNSSVFREYNQILRFLLLIYKKKRIRE